MTRTHESTTTTWHGEPAVQVTGGGGLVAVVVPGRGAKIASLRDSSGREWLLGPGPGVPSPARGPASFTDAEMCGWDECVPNVDADVLDGVPLPDHGEAWTTPWTLQEDGSWGFESRLLPYRFTRRIDPTATGLALVYTAAALGTEPVPFQWAAHPQLAPGPDARIELPAEATHVDGVYGLDGRAPWTAALADAEHVDAGEALKIWVAPQTPASWAGVRAADGSLLRLSWDVASVPYLALWVDAGMFARERVVALEPATGAREALSASREEGRAQLLEPGVPVTWTVHVEVLPSPDHR
ncbi:hypothetical protein [Cellulomonas cellasea]|uniref:Galactose mutarotase-like enzyme n=1 Tax=Cellulomonas cellasea TaxID=43670 RepID=A0A7W4YAQ3_9CELL|nr:hypothetical protein [Cellulomonas cellasea]MBB2923020.1 galactose mutarotase-like enzyme [Cellulomonas cellasea]